MAAVNIVLADASAVPVSHTFIPIGPDANRVFWFEDHSQDSPNGYWRISCSLKRPPPAMAGTPSNGRTYRAVIQLSEPVLEALGTETSSGIPASPTVAYIPRVTVEFVLPERAASIDRKHLRKMVANLLSEAQMTALVETLAMPF